MMKIELHVSNENARAVEHELGQFIEHFLVERMMAGTSEMRVRGPDGTWRLVETATPAYATMRAWKHKITEARRRSEVKEDVRSDMETVRGRRAGR